MAENQRPYALSALEAIMALGSGAVAEPLSGLWGLGNQAAGRDGAQSVKDVQSLAYSPRDPRALQDISELAQYPMDMYEKGTNWMGDTAFDATGSPAVATAFKTLPEMLGGAFGIKHALKQTPSTSKELGEPNQPPPDTIDPSKRKFLKNAGLLGAGVVAANAIPGRGLLDAALSPTAKTTAVSAIKSIPKMVPNDFGLASFFAGKLDLIDKIKNKNYVDDDGIISITNDRGDPVYVGEKPSDQVLDSAMKGDFEFDTNSVPRQGFHSPDALAKSLRDFDSDMGADDLLYHIMESIGNGTSDGSRLHPADVSKSIKELAKQHPDNVDLQGFSELSNSNLLKKASAEWEAGVQQYNGERSPGEFNWMYE